MGVFSNNRTTLGNDIDIPVAEGYKYIGAADVMLVEAVQTDMSLFEAMLGNDFAEVAALKEGTILESEMQAITEGALQSMVAKVKELLNKIIAKLKALFAAFMAKFHNVVIRDNKKFVDSIKKDLYNGKSYDAMEYKWREPFGEKAFNELGSVAHEMLDEDKEFIDKKYSELAEEQMKDLIKDAEATNLKEHFLAMIMGNSSKGSLTDAEFREEFEKFCFGEEKEKKGASADIEKAVKFLSGNPKLLKEISDSNKKWETKFKNKKKTWESKEKSNNSKSNSEKGEERFEYLKASYLSKVYTGMYAAIVTTHKAMVAAAKLEIKQYRQLLVKAVSYKPEADVRENAMIMMEAENAASYDVDTLVDDFDYDDEE